MKSITNPFTGQVLNFLAAAKHLAQQPMISPIGSLTKKRKKKSKLDVLGPSGGLRKAKSAVMRNFT